MRLTRRATLALPGLLPTGAGALSVERTWILFFGLNRSDLGDRQLEIIHEFAQAVVRRRSRHLWIAGHADNAELAGGLAEMLSQQRVANVAMKLREREWPLDMAIETHAYGADRLLIPTEAGVAEGQNRRVEMIIR